MKLTMDKLPIFQKLHHVCIVVRDIENAVKYYESIGVGPWTDFPPLDAYQLDGYDRPAFLKMRYKFANLDNAQLQLCQPGDGDTPQRRFLETRGEGVFHLGFSVESCDKAEELAASAGVDVLARGRLDDRSGFTYFKTVTDRAGITLEVRAPSTRAAQGIKS
jgi:methylmalonyl-CoA/ethylmalonyl-CoA epimerase